MGGFSFAARLKELREQSGLTQQGLAEIVGMTKGGLAHLEQGIREPTWATVQKLAEALGVDCKAFQVAPASTEKAPRGRPAKAETPAEDKPKRGRGRPRKA